MKELIKNLVESQNPIEEVSQYLYSFWQYDGAELEKHISEKEKFLNEFEKIFFEYYFDFFNTLINNNQENINTLKNLISNYPRVILFDSLSIRESQILKYTLQKEGYNITLKFFPSPIPTDTEKGFRALVYSPKIEEKIDGHLLDTIQFVLPDFIWCNYPDTLLHQKNETFEFSYQRTDNVLKNFLSSIKEKEILILSDHGYIYSYSDSFLWREQDKELIDLTHTVFANQRIVEITDKNKDDLQKLIINGIVKIHNNYAMILGRRKTFKGKRPSAIHGGLSLMECFIPVMVVRREI